MRRDGRIVAAPLQDRDGATVKTRRGSGESGLSDMGKVVPYGGPACRAVTC